MYLFSLHFFIRRYRRYRALLLTGNALSIANHLFLLAFSESVTGVTGVTGTFASALASVEWSGFGGHRPS
jgi:hypothetical protein